MIMKRKALLIGSAALFFLVVFFVWSTRRSLPGPKEGWLTYGNPALGFRVNYPQVYATLVSENPTGVSFGSDGGPWVYAVSVTPTVAVDTQAWMESQPEGNRSRAGIRVMSRLDRDPDFVVYSEYVVVDQDGSKPVYGEIIKASYVTHGRLFTIQSRDSQSPDKSPTPSADFLEMVGSFRLLK